MNRSEIQQILFGLHPAAQRLVISPTFRDSWPIRRTGLLCWRSWVVSFMSWNWHWISIELNLMVSSLKPLRESRHFTTPTPRQAKEPFNWRWILLGRRSHYAEETLFWKRDMWKCCRFQSNMASVYIANALVAMCLALCGTTLGQDANGRACVSASPCICSGTTVSCKNRQLRSIPEGIPLGTTSLWVRLFCFLGSPSVVVIVACISTI